MISLFKSYHYDLNSSVSRFRNSPWPFPLSRKLVDRISGLCNCLSATVFPYYVRYPSRLIQIPDQDLTPSALVDADMSFEPAVTTGRAYLPPAQRHPVDVIDDSIIVVGPARQKKRKRQDFLPRMPIQSGDWVSWNGNSKRPKQRQNADADDSLESFDYSKVPNILDDVPIPEQDPGKRKKKQQKQNQGMRCIVYVYVLSTKFIDILNKNREYGLWWFPSTPEGASGNKKW